MLIEYLGVGRFNPTFSGRTYVFERLPDYGDACVCDIQDMAFVARILKYKDGNGNLQCRRYPLDALKDPDLRRLVYRNPAATLALLTDFLNLMENGKPEDLEVDTTSLRRELLQKSVEELRVLAADMDIMVHPQAAPHICLGLIMAHVSRLVERAFEEPALLPSRPEVVPNPPPAPVTPAPAPPPAEPVPKPVYRMPDFSAMPPPGVPVKPPPEPQTKPKRKVGRKTNAERIARRG